MASPITTNDSGKSFTSRFKEHLSISRWSFPADVTHHSPPPSPTLSMRSYSHGFAGSREHGGIPEDVESRPHSEYRRAVTLRDRFTKIFFDVRTLDDHSSDVHLVPIPHLPEWGPLRIQKKAQDTKKKKSRSRRCCIIIVIIIILLLIGMIILIVLLVSSSGHKTTAATATPSQSPSNSSSTPVQSLSADQKQCIQEFTINAPSNPSSYPCSTCLPVLGGVTSSASSQDFKTATNAREFCGLKAVYDSSNTSAQNVFVTEGWLTNVGFCGWHGISCDSSGRVNSLVLAFPGVPSVIPTELGNLVNLQSMQLIGDGNVPAGPVPSSLQNLTSLSTLRFESTAITTLPDNVIFSWNKLVNLTVRSNLLLSANWSMITKLSLQTLIIREQSISNPLSDLASSTSLQSSLTTLDVSFNGISGTIPSSISALSALRDLQLDGNNLQSPLPTSFPPNLQILTLKNNTALNGIMPSSFCNNKSVAQCDLRNTSVTTGCGTCQYQ